MIRILCLLGILWSGISFAQTAEVSPLQMQQIESLQSRAGKLAFAETDINSYHLAKAHTWLDLALSEYNEKEEHPEIITSAISQASALLEALENKQADIPVETPRQMPGSEPVRPELWGKTEALKKRENFYCGQRQTAAAEIQLVWAGHERLEFGLSHSESYEHSAEQLLDAAKVAIDSCYKPPVIKKITLSGDALFDFDKATLIPSALARLDVLVDGIKEATKLGNVELVGHTDRLRSDGHPERNQVLSAQRAESIKRYLIEKGVPEDRLVASGAGSSKPLVECSTRQSKKEQAICLQPNRRVEIIMLKIQ